MKIKIKDVISIWNGMNALYKHCGKLDGTLQYFMEKQNFPILRHEIEKLQDVDEDIRERVKEKEIELPLVMITPDLLPSDMPRGILKLINPIIDGQPDFDTDSYESEIDKILKEATEENGGGETAETEPIPEPESASKTDDE